VEAAADAGAWFYADAAAPGGWSGPHAAAALAVALLRSCSSSHAHCAAGAPPARALPPARAWPRLRRLEARRTVARPVVRASVREAPRRGSWQQAA